MGERRQGIGGKEQESLVTAAHLIDKDFMTNQNSDIMTKYIREIEKFREINKIEMQRFAREYRVKIRETLRRKTEEIQTHFQEEMKNFIRQFHEVKKELKRKDEQVAQLSGIIAKQEIALQIYKGASIDKLILEKEPSTHPIKLSLYVKTAFHLGFPSEFSEIIFCFVYFSFSFLPLRLVPCFIWGSFEFWGA